jgi:hypothetical protein
LPVFLAFALAPRIGGVLPAVVELERRAEVAADVL